MPTVTEMGEPRNRSLTPILLFAVIGLAGVVTSALLLIGVERSRQELFAVRIALADRPAEYLETGEWYFAASTLLPPETVAQPLLRGEIRLDDASQEEIAGAIEWIDRYRERNLRAVTLLILLLMVTSFLLTILLIRAGTLVFAAMGERGRALELSARIYRGFEFSRGRLGREIERGIVRRVSAALCEIENNGHGDSRAATLLDESLRRSRYLAWRLQPPQRLTEELVESLSDLCEIFERETGVPVRFSAELRRKLGSEASLHLYRVVQELLTNAARHARASRVEISLLAGWELTTLVYEDDGEGIPEEAIEGRMGIGLTEMRDRASLLGGRLTIRSRDKGEGTRIELQVPPAAG